MKKLIFLIGFIICITFTVKSQSLPDSLRKQYETPKPTETSFDISKDTLAEFPEGNKEWRRFVESRIDGNLPSYKGAPSGIYTPIIVFTINTDGSITDIKAETNLGYGMEDECIRVIKKSPKWKPAIKNGIPVKSYRRYPLTFVVQ